MFRGWYIMATCTLTCTTFESIIPAESRKQWMIDWELHVSNNPTRLMYIWIHKHNNPCEWISLILVPFEIINCQLILTVAPRRIHVRKILMKTIPLYDKTNKTKHPKARPKKYILMTMAFIQRRFAPTKICKPIILIHTMNYYSCLNARLTRFVGPEQARAAFSAHPSFTVSLQNQCTLAADRLAESNTHKCLASLNTAGGQKTSTALSRPLIKPLLADENKGGSCLSRGHFVERDIPGRKCVVKDARETRDGAVWNIYQPGDLSVGGPRSLYSCIHIRASERARAPSNSRADFWALNFSVERWVNFARLWGEWAHPLGPFACLGLACCLFFSVGTCCINTISWNEFVLVGQGINSCYMVLFHAGRSSFCVLLLKLVIKLAISI